MATCERNVRLSGGEKRDPQIEEWLKNTDVLSAVARRWFKEMRACGEDVLELMHDGHPVACVEDAPFAYVVHASYLDVKALPNCRRCSLTASIDAVVFDLGGVLIDWNPRYLYRRLFGDDVEGMERFLSEVCTSAWNQRQDAGRPWEEAIDEAVARHPQHATLIRAYRERWEEMLSGPIAETVTLLDDLRDTRHRLYALTNWSQYTFPRALELFPFLHWFEDIVVSGREGLIKPDPAIFRVLLSRTGIEASRSVFIDDSLENIDAAAQLGFHTIHFGNATQLRHDLALLGATPRRRADHR